MKKGFILIAILAVVIVLAIGSVMVLQSMGSLVTMRSRTIKETQAYYMALAGLRYAAAKCRLTGCVDDLTYTGVDGTTNVRIDVTDLGGGSGSYRIDSCVVWDGDSCT